MPPPILSTGLVALLCLVEDLLLENEYKLLLIASTYRGFRQTQGKN